MATGPGRLWRPGGRPGKGPSVLRFRDQPVFIGTTPPVGGPYSFYDVLPWVADSYADDAAVLPLPVLGDWPGIVTVEAVDDFEEQVIEGATDDGALQPVFADQAEIVLVDSDPGEVEFEATDLVLDEAIGPVFAAGPEVAALDAEPVPDDEYDIGFFLDEAISAVFADQAEIVALDAEPAPDDLVTDSFDDNAALQPVFADQAEIVALDAEPVPDDEYDVGFFVDEAIGPVYGDGPELLALDAQDDAEEIVTEGATDDAALLTPTAATSDNEQIVAVSADDDEVVFEAADVAQTGPFDDVAAAATDVPTGPQSIYDVLGQLSGTRIVIPDGAPQEASDNEQIVALEAVDDFEDFVAESYSDDGALIGAAAQTDVPTGPLSIYDVLSLVTDSAHEPILIENTTDVPSTLSSVFDLLAQVTDSAHEPIVIAALTPAISDNEQITALEAVDDFEEFVPDSFADDGALFPPAVVPPDITEIVALQAEDDFAPEEGLALFEEKPGFDAVPPPVGGHSEWIIRARRRGRR
jgi:hypothetical protein